MFFDIICMNGFSTETAVCLRTLHYSDLTGVANVFMHRMIHIINCSEQGYRNFEIQIGPLDR